MVLVGSQVPIGFQLVCPGRAIPVPDCVPTDATLAVDGKAEKLTISGAGAGTNVTFDTDHTYHFEFVTAGGLPGRWPDTGNFTTRVVDAADLPRITANADDVAPANELTLGPGPAADQVGFKNASENDVMGPTGFDIDADGNALIVDWANDRMLEATTSGKVSVLGPTPQPRPLGIAVGAEGTRYFTGQGNRARVYSQRPGGAAQDLTAQFGTGVASGLARIGGTVVLIRGGTERVPIDGGEAQLGVIATHLDETTVVMTRPNGTLVGVQAPSDVTFGHILMQAVAKTGSVAAIQLLSTVGDPAVVGVLLVRTTDDQVVSVRTPQPTSLQRFWLSTVRWDASRQLAVINETTFTAFHLRWYDV